MTSWHENAVRITDPLLGEFMGHRWPYNDVIMDAIASQITSPASVYLAVYSGADQRKHQSSALLAFAGNSPGTGEFPAQMANNAENVSIWWRHHGFLLQRTGNTKFWSFLCWQSEHVVNKQNKKQNKTKKQKPTELLVIWDALTLKRCHSLLLRHNGGDGVTYYWRLHFWLNCWFRRRSKKTSKLRVTDLCEGNWLVVNSQHKRSVTRKMFPFDDVIMGKPNRRSHHAVSLL